MATNLAGNLNCAWNLACATAYSWGDQFFGKYLSIRWWELSQTYLSFLAYRYCFITMLGRIFQQAPERPLACFMGGALAATRGHSGIPWAVTGAQENAFINPTYFIAHASGTRRHLASKTFIEKCPTLQRDSIFLVERLLYWHYAGDTQVNLERVFVDDWAIVLINTTGFCNYRTLEA